MYNYNNISGRQKITHLSICELVLQLSMAVLEEMGTPLKKIISVIVFVTNCKKFCWIHFDMKTDDIWRRVVLIWDLGWLHTLGQKLFQSQDPTLTICGFPICQASVPVRGSSAVLTAGNIYSIILYIAF